MGENSKIEWTDHTFNPWIGCSKVSRGCEHCYAERLVQRFGTAQWGPAGTRERTSPTYWRQPLAWNRKAQRDGVRRRVFCASLADVFEDRPELETWRDELLALIIATPHLDWLLLTKRPDRMAAYFQARPRSEVGGWVKGNHRQCVPGAEYSGAWPPPNAWLGTSAEDQTTFDDRVLWLMRCGATLNDAGAVAVATVLFVSLEPLLSPIDASGVLGLHEQPCWCEQCAGTSTMERVSMVDWVIVGGESGPHARPMHPDWARSLRDQCQAAGVRFFFKQWGEWAETRPAKFCRLSQRRWSHETFAWAKDGTVYNPVQPPAHHFPHTMMFRVGKRAAGRLLDGVEHSEFPH